MHYATIIAGLSAATLTWLHPAPAKAAPSEQAWREVVIVQDITPGFSPHIAESRESALALLASLRDDGVPTKVGMVVFAGRARVWTPMQSLDKGYDNIVAQWEGLQPCYAGLNADGSLPSNHKMMPCNDGGDGAHVGAGVELAITHLLVEGEANTQRSIVLLTDGLPDCGTVLGCSLLERREQALWAGEHAAEESMTLFTVLLDKDPTGHLAHFYNAMLPAKHGDLLLVDKSTTLLATMQQLAADVPGGQVAVADPAPCGQILPSADCG